MFASAPQLPKLDAITKKKASTFTEKGGGGSSKASGGQIALFGQNKLSLGFQNLNTDFALPADFQKIKKLGKGAYGKVM